jgi:hypothetical protein
LLRDSMLSFEIFAIVRNILSSVIFGQFVLRQVWLPFRLLVALANITE